MIYFLKKQDLIDNFPLNGNVDVNDYIMNVKGSADMFTRNVLGTYFYNDLLTKYNNNTMNSNELDLLSYIQYTIGWRTIAETTITTSYEIKNKGVQKQSGDFSAAAEYKEIMYLVTHYQQKGDFYQNRLFQYLVENKDLFPVFLDKRNTDSTAKNACKQNGSNFDPGIYFI